VVYGGISVIELGKPELILLAPFFITLTLIGHYSAQRIKRSLELFHYPPVQRLIRMAAKKGVRRHSWRGVSLALKIAIVMLIAFALSSPAVLTLREIRETVEVPMVTEEDLAGGIVLAIDVSASMGLRDVAPSRLEAAKDMLMEFVENSSENVKFGIVAFDREIKDSLPLITDKEKVVSTIEDLTASEAMPCLEEWTDIGYGLQTSIDLLAPYASSNKTCAIILVSDGYANYGYPTAIQSVLRAAGKASERGIPIYAVHISRMGQDSNPDLMKSVADETQGEFLGSRSAEELKEALDFIGKYYVPTHTWSAKVEVKTTIPSRRELGTPLMLAATAVILTLWVGNYKHYRTSF